MRFRHPLIRSAVHEVSPPSARRSAHAALAAAYEELGDADRSARHLAAATVGPDATAAATVAAAATRARGRAAFAAASDAFEAAASLTPPGPERAERLAEAAEAAWSAGAAARSIALAESAGATVDDAQLRARLLHLGGRIELQAGSQSRAREKFLEAATLFEATDTPRAVAAIRLAVWACHFEGKIELSLKLARRVRELTPADGSTADLQAAYVLGRSLVLAGENAEGVPMLERTVNGLPRGRPRLTKQPRTGGDQPCRAREASREQRPGQPRDTARAGGRTDGPCLRALAIRAHTGPKRRLAARNGRLSGGSPACARARPDKSHGRLPCRSCADGGSAR